MNKILASDKVYVAKSKIKNGGRGVFALVDIKKGELIETCPVIQIPEHDEFNANGSILVTYFYYLGKKKQNLKLALGFGSIYNHSRQYNAEYKDKKDTIEFVATKNIKKNEEITVNYTSGNLVAKNPLWFE
jgi:uncharacterized protein